MTLNTHTQEMHRGKITKLQDAYQCHGAGGLYETHTSYIHGCQWRKMSPKSTKGMSRYQSHCCCSKYFQNPIQKIGAL